MKPINRRQFVRNSATAAAGLYTLPLSQAFAKKRKVSANDKIHLGLIGCRGVGWANLKSHLKIPDVEFIGLCDVDQTVLDERNAEFKEMTGKKLKEYRDFRKMLENKDLDAVIIATPDHWHALQTIYACEAGKDIYVEKPLANKLDECDAMVNAVRHFQRVCQVGQQQQSAPHWQNAIRYVHTGNLGKIRTVKTWAYIDWKGAVPVLPDQPAPKGVDYDMWLGPAPDHPFNPNRFHFTFRWFWDYAGGLMTDWGVHMLDMALYGMQSEGPKSVMALGGKFAYPDDAQQTPDTLQASYDFGDYILQWEHTIGIAQGPYNRKHGVAFVGENGTLVVDRGGWEVLPEPDRAAGEGQYRMERIPLQHPQGNDRDFHAQNFIECIKSRQDPVCTIEHGANVARVAHLGNAAYRLGRKVNWDVNTHQFIDDKEAAQLAKAEYRAPWKLKEY
jgi:predicted dehydrogenase